MLNEYGEEIYLDLKQHWGFDLASFFGGEVFSSCKLIVSMIRNLPEGSRYVTARNKDVDALPEGEDIKLTADETRQLDAQIWTFDRQLQAMVINSINSNTVMTGGPWKDDSPPKFPVAGPIDWDPERKRKLAAKEKVETGNWDNWDVAKALGIPEAMFYTPPKSE